MFDFLYNTILLKFPEIKCTRTNKTDSCANITVNYSSFGQHGKRTQFTQFCQCTKLKPF